MKKRKSFDRNAHNEDLIKRMKDGEDLHRINQYESWYPQRPKIEKDKEAIRKLYGSEKKDNE